MQEHLKILAIETSCDDTSLAVVECSGDLESLSFNVLTHESNSQALAHRKYGGVYPNLAKSLHSKNCVPLLKNVLENANLLHKANTLKNYSNVLQNIGIVLEREPELFEQFSQFIPIIEKPDVDAIAVTHGPGLEPSLWVGINFAKALSLTWDMPLIPVNHMEGHIASVMYNDNTSVLFPALSLLVSGGHTQLVLASNWGKYKILGATRDDAAGEAFDKVARILDLPYPGGPEISRLADSYSIVLQNNRIAENKCIKLPRPMINSNDYDFSFSGLKTAVLYLLKDIGELTQEHKQEISFEFQNAVTDILVSKTEMAINKFKPKTLIVAGGVSANAQLQIAFKELTTKLPIELKIPHRNVTGDNAIMIGIAGYLRFLLEGIDDNATKDIRADGNLSLESA